MDVGLNTFLLTGRFTDRETGLLDRIAGWGFDAVEITVQEAADIDPARFTRELERTGLRCCCLCGVFPPGRDLRGTPGEQEASAGYLRSLIDLAPKVGAPVIAGPFYSCVGRTGAHDAGERRRQAETVAGHLRALGRQAHDAGLVLAMEPLNRFETDMVNTCEQALALIGAADSPALKVHLDTFHMNIEEKDPAGAIRRAGDRLGHLHLSGSDRGAPGKDHLDWPALFRALRETGYAGAAVIESFTPEVEVIARAAAIWRDIEPSSESLARDGLAFIREMLSRPLS
jgi:D-psicose/D-tagatose/L-ribulose 3-epimerase